MFSSALETLVAGGRVASLMCLRNEVLSTKLLGMFAVAFPKALDNSREGSICILESIH